MIPFLANAQFKKGDSFLGGTISYQGTEGDVDVTPFVGYFVNPRLALGASLQVGYAKSEQPGQYNGGIHQMINTTRDFTAALTAQRFYTIADKFFFSLRAAASYTRTSEKVEILDYDITSYNNLYSVGAEVTPLFLYFPSSRWSIEAGLGSLKYAFTRGLTDRSNRQNVSLDFGKVSLGFVYYFRKS